MVVASPQRGMQIVSRSELYKRQRSTEDDSKHSAAGINLFPNVPTTEIAKIKCSKKLRKKPDFMRNQASNGAARQIRTADLILTNWLKLLLSSVCSCYMVLSCLESSEIRYFLFEIRHSSSLPVSSGKAICLKIV